MVRLYTKDYELTMMPVFDVSTNNSSECIWFLKHGCESAYVIVGTLLEPKEVEDFSVQKLMFQEQTDGKIKKFCTFVIRMAAHA